MTKRIIIGRALKVSPEELVTLPWRKDDQGNVVEVRVTQHMYDSLCLLRPALKEVARQSTTITYGKACEVMSAYSPQGTGDLMDVLSVECQRRGEPSLASLVVRKDTGEVGYAFSGDPARARRECYAFWRGR